MSSWIDIRFIQGMRSIFLITTLATASLVTYAPADTRHFFMVHTANYLMPAAAKG
jgi:hypothetical protein